MIVPGLYLGNFASVLNAERLRRLGISHILILAYPTPQSFEQDFRYMCIELIDDHKQNLFRSLSDGIMFIQAGLDQYEKAQHKSVHESRRGGVLVASTKGQSRSAAFVIGYFIYARQMTLASAMTFVRLKRREAHPNSSFQQQLGQFYDSLWSGPFMQESTKNKISKFMAPPDNRRKLTAFRGVSLSPGIVEMSQRIGDRVGLAVQGNAKSSETQISPNIITPMKRAFEKRGSYSLEQTQVMKSNRPLITIRKEDLAQIAIENPTDTNLSKQRTADLLSRNVAAALFGPTHSSMVDMVERVDRKRASERRQSEPATVFKKSAKE